MKPKLTLLCVALLAGAAQAQLLRPSTELQSLSRLRAAAQAPRSADYIVALVNSEPITNHEIRAATVRVEPQMA